MDEEDNEAESAYSDDDDGRSTINPHHDSGANLSNSLHVMVAGRKRPQITLRAAPKSAATREHILGLKPLFKDRATRNLRPIDSYKISSPIRPIQLDGEISSELETSLSNMREGINARLSARACRGKIGNYTRKDSDFHGCRKCQIGVPVQRSYLDQGESQSSRTRGSQ